MSMTRARRRLASLALAVAVMIAAGLPGCGDDAAPDTSPGADAADDRTTPPADAAVDAAPVRADFGLDTRPSNTTCKAPARPPSGAAVTVERAFANVFFQGVPIAMAQAPGDPSRWFVAQRDGRIVTFASVNPAADPVVVADVGALSGMPVNQAGEGGLLGLAFHPKFAQNGHLFVSWTTTGPNTSGIRSIVSRITTTNGGASFGQHTTILGPFDQPFDLHKGGGAKFGPDGFLYLGFGDGGDAAGSGQSAGGFLSKILRLDVDSGAAPVIHARGFRNPFRFSIDRETGDLWVGDVGQDQWEEIDVVKAGGNYGWPCREGAHDLDPALCTGNESLIDPVHEYPHAGNAAVTGGVVYRGSKIAGLAGAYVFGDSYNQDLYALTLDPSTGATKVTTLNASGPRDSFVDFAEDAGGEIFIVGYGSGILYRLVAAQPAPPSAFPDRLSKTGCVDPADPKRPASGLVPYDVNAPFWSDGADKERFLALPDGARIGVGADGDFDLPIGSVLVKTFSIGGRRIETRLYVRHDDGEWAGYSYEWNDAQTDGVLLPSSKSKKVGAQTWSFPSRGQCAGCHSSAAGRTLGLELGQLNREVVYTATNRLSNQLRTLEHIGMLAAPLGRPVEQIVAYPNPTAGGPAEPRARAYLHASCAGCHRPGGPGRGDLDLRFATPLAATKACGTRPQLGDLGVTGAKVVTPSAPEKSVLSLRPHALGAARMPPIASNVVDVAGLAVVDDWIRALAACP